MASQIIGVSIVCSTVCSGSDQRKHDLQFKLWHALHHFLYESIPFLSLTIPQQQQQQRRRRRQQQQQQQTTTTTTTTTPGNQAIHTQIAEFMGPTWGPPGSCRP